MRRRSVLITPVLLLSLLLGPCAVGEGAIVTPISLEVSTQPAYRYFGAGPITPDGRFILFGTDALDSEGGTGRVVPSSSTGGRSALSASALTAAGRKATPAMATGSLPTAASCS